MDRRTFLKIAGSTGVVLGTPLWSRYARAAAPHVGPFWVTVHASGGWDPTLLCDPKGNASPDDASPINDYLTSDILDIGPFRVAPVDGHQAFFERFRNELLVINGIDAQTVSHDTGTRHTWSGSTGPNVPAFTALTAATTQPQPSLAFLSNGGYDRTGGLVAPTRIPDTGSIEDLAYPDRLNADDPDSTLFSQATHERIRAAGESRLARMREVETLPRVARAQDMLAQAFSGENELARMIEFLPEIDDSNRLFSQAQLAMAAFKAGVSVSANLTMGSFDTHGNHDSDHRARMQELIAGVAFVMDEAERQGIADQVVVIVGSEFGRTPWYNEQNGKDHWSVTSMMAMGRGIRGGRVIGATTDDQYPLSVNPTTLAVDESGVRITPSDIHAALRQLAGIQDDPMVVPWPVGNALPLFT